MAKATKAKTKEYASDATIKLDVSRLLPGMDPEEIWANIVGTITNHAGVEGRGVSANLAELEARVTFDAEDEWELANQVRDLRDELDAMSLDLDIEIPRPKAVA